MQIALGSDHAGFFWKQEFAEHPNTLDHQVLNLGTDGPARVDRPKFAKTVGLVVAEGRAAGARARRSPGPGGPFSAPGS